MIKVSFLPLYNIQGPSSRYRVYQLIPFLSNYGFECRCLEAPERKFWKRNTYLPRLITAARKSDILFIQKRTFPLRILDFLHYLNPQIIFDFDDAIFLETRRREQVDAILSKAKWVIAGNEYLAVYAQQLNHQVSVIPTVVDINTYTPPPKGRYLNIQKTIIGWIGTNPNRGDFAAMQPVLDWLCENYAEQVVVRIIANRPLEIKTKLPIEFIPWKLETSRSELQKFDIGLMPMENNPWNHGKCGLKLIQYMAVGAVPLASPVGVNQTIIRAGETGLLADTVEQWTSGLKYLIDNPKIRVDMGHQGRLHVEKNFSVQSILPALLKVLNQTASP
jgi:glycosyltransferase involved in cell wall biosynthesis